MSGTRHNTLVSARRSLAVALSAMVVLTVSASVLLGVVEGWDFFRALFFVIITITTVGYGDEGISVAGRWITVAVMLLGIGGTTYAFALIVKVVFAHGADWRFRMRRRIEGLSGHTVVVGFGRMGHPLASELRDAGRTVVVVDFDADRTEQARDEGFLVLRGDATDEAVLEAAGVSRAAQVATCLDDSAKNLAVVLSARDLSSDAFILGRINGPNEERRMRLAGADKVVSPLHAGAVDALRLLVRPAVTELASNHLEVGLDLGMVDVTVHAGSKLDGSALRDVYGHVPSVTFVLRRPRNGDIQLRPPPDVVLCAEDVLVVVGLSPEVQWLSDSAVTRAAA